MIDKRRPRRRKPRINQKRSSNQLRTFDNKNPNVPRTRIGLSKALEKYTNLAQDAVSNGDRIVAENFFQYAEHYLRVLNDLEPEEGRENNLSNVQSFNEKKDDEKLSRTERAVHAKNLRTENKSAAIQKHQGEEKNISNKNPSQKKDQEYTSDGMEALKPFEV